MTNEKVNSALIQLSANLESIRQTFVDGVKMTLLVRNPEIPEQDFVMTEEDDKSELIGMLDRYYAGENE